MRKVAIVLLALSFATPAMAWHVPVVPPKPVPPIVSGGGGAATGAAVTGGFIAFVAALALYDIQRRWTCSGDYLHLGGPGFNEKMPKYQNVKSPPKCGAGNTVIRANVVRVKG